MQGEAEGRRQEWERERENYVRVGGVAVVCDGRIVVGVLVEGL